jgi:hemerythrin
MSSQELFKWSPTLTVGDDRLDGEHKEIIQKMNDLFLLNKRAVDKARLLSAYDDFVTVTRHHFQDEELHMKKMGYVRLESHKKAHVDLLTSLGNFRNELTHSVYAQFPSSVFDFFKTWLASHIMIVDRSYADFQSTSASGPKPKINS